MELVKRYIAAVQRELPERSRHEIGRELNANIMDQLDALSAEKGSLTEADIADVLQNMGSPSAIAQQYEPSQPLVSASYMPLYRHTLYMVLGVLFILSVVVSTIHWLNTEMSFFLYLKGILSGFVEDSIFAFTAITLAFAVMSSSKTKQGDKPSCNWQPNKLPAIGADWQYISLQTIFSNLATYAFLLIVIWQTTGRGEFNRLWLTDNGLLLLQCSSLLIIASIGFSLWQLKLRYWTKVMLQLNALQNACYVGILVYLAFSVQLAQLNLDYLQGGFTALRLQQSVMLGLAITALFPLAELVRDVRRLLMVNKQS